MDYHSDAPVVALHSDARDYQQFGSTETRQWQIRWPHSAFDELISALASAAVLA